MTKDNPVNEGSIIPSAVGAQVYHQPDDVMPTPSLAVVPVPDKPAVREPAASPPSPIDEALARSRAIVAFARFTRKVDKKDPTCETIEIRRRSAQPIGEPGAVITMTGDEAIMELTGFCVGYLQAMGILPADDVIDGEDTDPGTGPLS